MRSAWAAGVASLGLLLVGVVYGCIWYAIPNRPIAREWLMYGSLLLGPYVLASVGCGFSADRFVRGLAGAIVLAGLLSALAALSEAWDTFLRGRPPDMPASGFIVSCLMLGQYWAGIAAAVSGLASRNSLAVTPDAAQKCAAPHS